ncbi:MAG TPA: flavin reductase family protein [Gemmataceae bacterium]|jgi:flavin reductase (DIM6/NTAB) family NADH-FMN oxidoreductase RutF|nr:flavin reductase family protein [Gemmataceae bacterium]
MQIDVAGTPVVDVYHMLVGVVTPRPIAWVTTVDPAGRVNLAPFSFFNAFGANPPVVVFSPTRRRDATKKDTLLNVEATGEFVVHASVASLAEKVNQSSKEIPPGESEIELVGLHTTPSVKVKPPRLTEAPVAMECKVRQIVPVGDGPIAANLVIGEVLMIHVDDAILDAQGKPDPRKLRTVARLGGDYWCHTTDLFEQKRP